MNKTITTIGVVILIFALGLILGRKSRNWNDPCTGKTVTVYLKDTTTHKNLTETDSGKGILEKIVKAKIVQRVNRSLFPNSSVVRNFRTTANSFQNGNSSTTVFSSGVAKGIGTSSFFGVFAPKSANAANQSGLLAGSEKSEFPIFSVVAKNATTQTDTIIGYVGADEKVSNIASTDSSNIYIYSRSFKDTNLVFNLTDSIQDNKVVGYGYAYKLLQPKEVITTTYTKQASRFGLSVGATYQANVNVLTPTAIVKVNRWQGSVGYGLQNHNYTVGAFYNLVK